MADRAKVLIVEDEDFYSDDYVEQLTEQRYNSRAYDIQIANDLQTADVRLKAVEPDIVLLDLRFPPRHEPEEGLDFLKKIKAFRAEIKVIVVTGERDANVGLAAIECGAYDFVQKHSESHSELAFRVNHAYERLQLERELAHTKDEQFSALGGYPYDRSQMIVGASEEMKALYAQIGQVAPTNATVLILGENGTGKELVARAIHYHSPRRHHPIITVNCSAIPAGLIESELFGYVKGSHSTATSDKKGLFAQADGSTLFLDEIGELPLALQVKLLRALQEGEIRPVGANAPTKIDCRIIGSTNKDLEAAIKDGAFREDLYFRLNVVSLTVPTLRERKSDIALLAKHFLQAKVSNRTKLFQYSD